MLNRLGVVIALHFDVTKLERERRVPPHSLSLSLGEIRTPISCTQWCRGVSIDVSFDCHLSHAADDDGDGAEYVPA